jgi:probable phosphoglycerate mutase
MLLYLIRHGDPDYETDSLTDRGKLQAEAVGKRMFDAKIDRIFSSPMGRARETAEPACRLLGLEKSIEEWTHEILDERLTPFPDGINKSVTDVQNTYFRENGNQDLPFDRACECPGFQESRMQDALDYIAAGGKDFLERLGYREENGVYRILRKNEDKVALFCHAAFTRAWLTSLLHIPAHIVWASFHLTHTGVTVLEFKNNKNGVTAPQCLCYSDLSHLYAHGPAVLYNERIPL